MLGNEPRAPCLPGERTCDRRPDYRAEIEHEQKIALFSIFFCLLLLSCGEERRSEVGGVDDEFCVPRDYLPQGVWFVPDDPPGTPQGFSFGGCRRLPEETQSSCGLPEDFLSASVGPLSEKRNQLWGELKEAVAFDQTINRPGVRYFVDPQSGWLVVSNEHAEQRWFIWERDAHARANSAEMIDSARLVVWCSTIEGLGIGATGRYECDRYVRGSEYALTYEFYSKAKIPTRQQIERMDSALFDQVERWRCPRSGAEK